MSDPSLEDIAFVLAPSFTAASIANFTAPGSLQKPSYDLSSKPYVPGYIGLNDIKRNDYMNVIIHSLLHVAPPSKLPSVVQLPRQTVRIVEAVCGSCQESVEFEAVQESS